MGCLLVLEKRRSTLASDRHHAVLLSEPLSHPFGYLAVEMTFSEASPKLPRVFNALDAGALSFSMDVLDMPRHSMPMLTT